MEELKKVKLCGSENYQVWKYQIGIILSSMENGYLWHTIKPTDDARLKDVA